MWQSIFWKQRIFRKRIFFFAVSSLSSIFLIISCASSSSAPSIQSYESDSVSSTQPPESQEATQESFNRNFEEVLNSENFSSGGSILLTYEISPNAQRGAEFFTSAEYEKAIEFFGRAVEDDRGNPEAQIYLNNAQARLAGSQLLLAVVVPIDGAANSAEEILRGVADAQTEFNKSGGIEGKLLEITIANDGNAPEISTKVAEALAGIPEVLGVIGHNSSTASEAAISVYEKASLPMVSPTSTSIYLSSDIFFRTVPSDKIAGSALAQFVLDDGLEESIIFYNKESNYSRSIQEAFTGQFLQSGGSVVDVIDISDSEFSPSSAVQNFQGKAESIILLPNKSFVSVALSIARANAELPDGLQMRLVGNDAMYSPETLSNGGSAVEGLVLAVPWFAQTPYAGRAEERWGGGVSWRTATSYDATLSLIESLSDGSSREAVLKALSSVELPSNRTSGDELRFSLIGERITEPVLVQAVRGTGGPQGSNFAFRMLKDFEDAERAEEDSEE